MNQNVVVDDYNTLQSIVRTTRNILAEHKVAVNKQLLKSNAMFTVVVSIPDERLYDVLSREKYLLKGLTKVLYNVLGNVQRVYQCCMC